MNFRTIKIIFSLLILFSFPVSAQQIVEVVKDGQAYVCKNIKSIWKPGKYKKGKFYSFKKLVKINRQLYKETGLKKYLKLVRKFKKLKAKGLIACNHTCGNQVVDLDINEECDDGNAVNDDACTNACKVIRVSQIAAGGYGTCALLTNGKARCWGDAMAGRLGYGNLDRIGDDETPASAGDIDIGGSVVQIETSYQHTCAVLDTGAARCWGAGGDGLGYGLPFPLGDDEAPASAGDLEIGGTVTQVALGDYVSCALLDTGAVRCWGDGSIGQLGYGNTEHIGDNETPESAGDINLGGIATQIVSGPHHVCALLDTGAVRCWGEGAYGKLGYGNANNIGDNETPAIVGDIDLGGIAIQITAGTDHTCALLDTGLVKCWGRADTGQLGYGNGSTDPIGDNETPASVGYLDLGGTAIQITAGEGHTCALLDTGSVKCWGLGWYGKLGYGNTNWIGINETPAHIGNIKLGGNAIQIETGDDHTCALLDDYSVKCWGLGSYGQLGYGNTNFIGDNEKPESVGTVSILD